MHFIQKKLDFASKDFHLVQDLFMSHLYGEGINITSAWAVYNPTLVAGFTGDFIKWNRRLEDNQQLFQKSDWEDHIELRTWVMSKFKDRVDNFSWNKEKLVPIIPAVHGTDVDKAFKICNGGFASLNTLDAGFFGKGIYMTSVAEYALRYAGAKPAIIITYIMPGHPFPVVEDHRQEDFSLLGAALQSGCQSHYVRTDVQGFVVTEPTDDSYDEIVLAQENLVVPAFILEIDPMDMLKLKTKLEKAMAAAKRAPPQPLTTRASTKKKQRDIVGSRDQLSQRDMVGSGDKLTQGLLASREKKKTREGKEEVELVLIKESSSE